MFAVPAPRARDPGLKSARPAVTRCGGGHRGTARSRTKRRGITGVGMVPARRQGRNEMSGMKELVKGTDRYRHYVNGEWVLSTVKEWLEVENPATGDVIAGPADVP